MSYFKAYIRVFKNISLQTDDFKKSRKLNLQSLR